MQSNRMRGGHSLDGSGPVPEAAAVGGDLLVHGRTVLAGAGFLVGLVTEVLQLYIEVIGIEDLAEVEESGAGIVVTTRVDQISDLAVTTGGEADEARGVDAERIDGEEWRSLPVGVGEMGGGKEAA